MRILAIHVKNGYSPEARVLSNLLGHRREGDEVLVLHHTWPGDDSPGRFAAAAHAEVRTMDLGWRPNLDGRRPAWEKASSRAWFPLMMPRLVRLAARFQPDVVVSTQQSWDVKAATRIARWLRVPQVIHLHYTVGPWLGRPALERLRTCEQVVTVSEFIRGMVLEHGVAPERVTAVVNPFTPFPVPTAEERAAVRRELGYDTDHQLVGIVARIDPYKGHAETIDAFSTVAAAHPRAHLLVVGSGTLQTEMEQRARASAASERIHFLGRRSDVPRLLTALDVFAHPSHWDPCPLAVLEAAAAGLPVLAFADGGAPELVVDGRTGLLAPPGNVPQLTQRLHTLLAQPEQARAMGAAARKRIATDFQPQAAADRFMAVLARATSQPGGDRSPHHPSEVPQ